MKQDSFSLEVNAFKAFSILGDTDHFFSAYLPNIPSILIFFIGVDVNDCFCNKRAKIFVQIISAERAHPPPKKPFILICLQDNFLTKQGNYFWSHRDLSHLIMRNKVRKASLFTYLYFWFSFQSNPFIQQKICSVLELFCANLASGYLLKHLC